MPAAEQARWWGPTPSVALAVCLLACASELSDGGPRPELEGVGRGGYGGAPVLPTGGGGTGQGGTTTTTTTTTTSTGGGGGGSPTCDDWGEPNDAEMDPYDFGGINDCDGEGKSITAALDGSDDADWYTYQGTDALGCVVDPNCVLIASAGDSARVCKYATCLSGGTDVTCKDGASATTSPGGRSGCCHTQGFSMGLECSGMDDDADMFIRVDQGSAACVTYSLSFHY